MIYCLLTIQSHQISTVTKSLKASVGWLNEHTLTSYEFSDLNFNYSSSYGALVWFQLEFIAHISLKYFKTPLLIFHCRTCEICNATAVNVAGEQIHEAENTMAASTTEPVASAVLTDSQRSWHGRRVMNVLLACMIVVFVISWLFHFNVIS